MKLPRGIRRDRLRRIVKRMPDRRVAVLGDVVLDEYLFGRSKRISREAPVAIVEHERSEYRLGGAANVAHNLAALGARVAGVALLGPDEAGERLVELAAAAGVDVSGLLLVPGYVTPHKTRILAGSLHTRRQQMLRVDRGGGEAGLAARRRLTARLREASADAEAIVVSDYGHGTVGQAQLTAARALAERLPVCGDSRYQVSRFRGFTAVTPNAPEVERALQVRLGAEAAAGDAGERLRKQLRLPALLLTRGRQGMMLFTAAQAPVSLAAFGRDEVTDVTGAGDTVLATFSLALAAGGSPVEAACLANLAGGQVVLKAGAATVSTAELLQAVGSVGR